MSAATTDADTLRSVLREYLDAHAPVTTALADPGRTAAFVTTFRPASLLVPEQAGRAVRADRRAEPAVIS